MIKKIYNHFMDDHLYRNSMYIMASNAIMAVMGFGFWIIVARLFPAHNVGIATTLISMAALLSNFSLLGFNISLMRYLPQSTQRNEKINSALLLILIASLISSAIFMLGLPLFSPKLAFMQADLLYGITFTLFVIGVTFNSILDAIFLAYRAAGNILIKSTIISSLKLLFPLVLVMIGAYGIFASVSFATLIGVFVGFVILTSKYSYSFTLSFHKEVVQKMARFSTGNYFSSFLSQAPALLLPLLIINRLNAETAAYFYMDMMILSFLRIITVSTTDSLMTEGSYDESKLQENVIKAAKIILLVLIPAVILILLFGNFILTAFGKSYASEAFSFLQLISISSLFTVIAALGSSILRVRKEMSQLIAINFIGDILVLGLAYALIDHGLIGVGIGWLMGKIILAVIYLYVLRKDFISPFSHKVKALKLFK